MKKFFLIIAVSCLFVRGPACAQEKADGTVDRRAIALEFITMPDVVTLSTVDLDGYPQARAMLNLRHEKFPQFRLFPADSFETVFATGTDTEKIKHIKSNNRASVFFYVPNLTTRSLLLLGTVEIIDDQKEKSKYFSKDWLAHYPKGPSDPNLTLLRFVPTKARFYYRSILEDFDI